MVKQEIIDTYERLLTKQELYKRATRFGNSLSGLGFLVFIFSLIPVIPILTAKIVPSADLPCPLT